MNPILLILLLWSINCINCFDVTLCLTQSPNFKEKVINIYEVVKTKDF